MFLDILSSNVSYINVDHTEGYANLYDEFKETIDQVALSQCWIVTDLSVVDTDCTSSIRFYSTSHDTLEFVFANAESKVCGFSWRRFAFTSPNLFFSSFFSQLRFLSEPCSSAIAPGYRHCQVFCFRFVIHSLFEKVYIFTKFTFLLCCLSYFQKRPDIVFGSARHGHFTVLRSFIGIFLDS